MSLILEIGQVCPHAKSCSYNTTGPEFCQGALATRKDKFVCEFANQNGIIKEDGFRSRFDQTGKMKIIMETPQNGWEQI